MSFTRRIESPFPKYPGYLEIATFMDATQYNDWYNRVAELRMDLEDDRHEVFKTWDARFGLIIDAKMKLPKGYEIERSGMKLPNPQIAYWFVNETKALIDEANDAKNWLGPSADTSTTEQS